MAEQIPFSIAEKLLSKLGSLAFQEIGLIYGVKKDLKKLENSLSTIKAVLLDAEEKQEQSHAVENWIRRLKEIVYEADELLDEVATEDLRRKMQGQVTMARQVSEFFSSSWFHLKVGRKIKDIGEKLNELKNEISSLNLMKKEIVVDVRDKKNSRRETDSYVVKSEIIGREGDKENITESLLHEEGSSQESVSVVAVVGFGGLGKTTLAQLVYNDEKVVNYFDMKMWVCVSEDFDVKLLIKKILKCVSSIDVANLELEQLQRRLRENLQGKRYLLVLDDVWNEDMQLWDCLKKYLLVGGKGSKILVTSRSKIVASVMGVDSPYDLKGLTDNQAWDLFQKLAFRRHNTVNPNIIKIGRKIVEKCKGVPLAIRALGGLMHLKTRESDWSTILENDLWSSFQSRRDIFPVLKLSYYHLPIYLRQCFAYCAMFPKDYEFDKEILIYIWMAQGYIVPLDNNESLEDIGEQYFNELLYRSFFHLSESRYSEKCYKMHDLIHDLAKLIAKDSCIVLENNMESVSKRVHHVYSWLSSSIEIRRLIKVQGMRTLFALYVGDDMQFEKIASNFQSLHALHLTSSFALEFRPLTSQIGKLKYLRYLNFSDCSITELPNSITNLLNLQTLILSNCWSLIELPRDIKKLVSLRCLMIDGCDPKCMPIGLGKLTSLQKLSNFVVAKEDDECSCSRVGTRSGKGMLNELNGLNQLRGKIVIERLENVKNVELEAKEVNLREKKHLKSLRLEWEKWQQELYGAKISELMFEKSELLLKKLEPHPNLQELDVYGFLGVRFSSWLSNITNIVTITLSTCVKLKHLPPLHQLPSLKTLHLSKLYALEYISDDDRPSPSQLAFFPSLQYIYLDSCRNLKGWWRSGVENKMPKFPCLSQLNIQYCKNLTWMMATSSSFKLLNLQYIWSLESLSEEWLQNLTSLQKLEIIDCPVLVSIYQGMRHLTCLQNLRISNCNELIIDSDDDNGLEWGCLRSLQSLSFQDLPNMISLPKGLQFVTTLQKLTIYGCDRFTALPDWIGNLTSLQILKLVSCPKLMSVPQGMHKLTSLQELGIKNCIHLSETCSKGRGIDWPKIAHIPNVVIKDLSDLGMLDRFKVK